MFQESKTENSCIQLEHKGTASFLTINHMIQLTNMRTVIRRIMAKLKVLLLISFLLCIFLHCLLLWIYYRSNAHCMDSTVLMKLADVNNLSVTPKYKFSGNDLNKRNAFDFNKDVIVFVHIQKTGGTRFGEHLVSNLRLESPCKCIKLARRCQCFTKNGTMWLFGNAYTGWGCGLHADWTELVPCVEGVLNKIEKQHRLRK